MGKRAEFKNKTKDAAWERSGKACEAEGPLYGLPAGVRCGADLTLTGAEYDHIILDANSKDNSLENCCCACPRCHRWKTTHIDIPTAAKTVRQQKKARGQKRPKGFGRFVPQPTAITPLTKCRTCGDFLADCPHKAAAA